MPPAMVINQYFAADKKAIEQLEADKEAIAAQVSEMKEEHTAEDGCFTNFDKVNKHPRKYRERLPIKLPKDLMQVNKKIMF